MTIDKQMDREMHACLMLTQMGRWVGTWIVKHQGSWICQTLCDSTWLSGLLLVKELPQASSKHRCC